MNIFGADHATNPSGPATHPQEAILGPGDVLFIPPLWLHASSPLENTSISINVFFRNLEAGYAAGRDVYGNRDVHAYEKARKDVARMVKSFDHLPAPMSRFYLERLASELREKAVSLAPWPGLLQHSRTNNFLRIVKRKINNGHGKGMERADGTESG